MGEPGENPELTRNRDAGFDRPSRNAHLVLAQHQPVEAYGVSRTRLLWAGVLICPARKDSSVFHSLRRWLAAGSAVAVALVGLVAAPAPAQAIAPTGKVSVASVSRPAKAANWLAKNPAGADDGYVYKIYSATGLAALSTSSTTATLRKRVKELRSGAAAAVAAKPTVAPYLAILADALHLNPRDFGGVNLVQTIQAGASDGESYTYAYGQALAIIALKRADATVPSSLVTSLLAGQNTTGADAGAFGYSWGGTYYPDPDSTALAIQALDVVGKTKYADQVKKAAAWAKKTQQRDGYWDAYSKVDSTSLLATALKTVKASTTKSLGLNAVYTKAAKWLAKQQLSNGGFPGTGTQADLMATFDASFLLTGKAWSTFSYKLRHFSKISKPTITGTTKVGSTLTAKLPGWTPKIVNSTTVTYQWLRNGKKVTGATASSYLLTAADKGKRIQVRVKVAEIGLVTVVKTSSPTKKISA